MFVVLPTTRRSVFSLLLAALLAVILGFRAAGDMMIDALVVPPVESDAWALASAGAHRYAGGWHSLDEPIDVAVTPGQLLALSPLRKESPKLEMLPFATRIWRAPLTGQLSVVEQLLFAWTLRLPVHAPSGVELHLVERMLLVPNQIRIAIAANEVEVPE